MEKIVKIHNKNNLPATKEYFLLNVPKETELMLFVMLLFVIMAIFIICFCKIDDVVKVKGIVRASGNVSSVENMVSGKISSICFMRGQKVEKGDLLYTMDTSVLDLQKENLKMQGKDIEKKLSDAENLR